MAGAPPLEKAATTAAPPEDGPASQAPTARGPASRYWFYGSAAFHPRSQAGLGRIFPLRLAIGHEF